MKIDLSAVESIMEQLHGLRLPARLGVRVDLGHLFLEVFLHDTRGYSPEEEPAPPRCLCEGEPDLARHEGGGRKRSRYSPDCEADVVHVLEEAGHRLTLCELERALAAAGRKWNDSTLSHTCAALVRAGRLTSATTPDNYGKGYGLPAWQESAA